MVATLAESIIRPSNTRDSTRLHIFALLAKLNQSLLYIWEGGWDEMVVNDPSRGHHLDVSAIRIETAGQLHLNGSLVIY